MHCCVLDEIDQAVMIHTHTTCVCMCNVLLLLQLSQIFTLGTVTTELVAPTHI